MGSYFLFAQAKMPHSEICMMFHIYCVDRENRPITGVTILWPETNKTFVIPRHFSRYGWIVENDHCEIDGVIKKVRDLETTYLLFTILFIRCQQPILNLRILNFVFRFFAVYFTFNGLQIGMFGKIISYITSHALRLF